MSKQPFSFPVRFSEELNALNFAYKSIHLMAHHGQWYCSERADEITPCTFNWHRKYMPNENVLFLQEKKKSCTRFHYLCRFVDTNDVITYDFVHLHDLCEEWEYNAEEKPNRSTFGDPFGFGYYMDTFKRYTFSHIILYDAYMIKPKRSRSMFSIFVRDSKHEKPSNQVMSFGREIQDLINNNKSSRLFADARALSSEPKAFIAAFFGFCSYSHIRHQGGENTETVSDETRLLYMADYEKLFYRPC